MNAESMVLVMVAFLSFWSGFMFGYVTGIEDGRKQYHKGEVVCEVALEKTYCKKKEQR